MIDAENNGIQALDVQTIAEVIVKLSGYRDPQVAFTTLREMAAPNNWVIPAEGLPN